MERKDGPVKTEAEIRFMLPQTKECLELPETRRGRILSWRLWKGQGLANNLVVNF